MALEDFVEVNAGCGHQSVDLDAEMARIMCSLDARRPRMQAIDEMIAADEAKQASTSSRPKNGRPKSGDKVRRGKKGS